VPPGPVQDKLKVVAEFMGRPLWPPPDTDLEPAQEPDPLVAVQLVGDPPVVQFKVIEEPAGTWEGPLIDTVVGGTAEQEQK